MINNNLHQIAMTIALSAVGTSALNIANVIGAESSLSVFFVISLVATISSWLITKPKNNHTAFFSYKKRKWDI